ncbi:aminotransferase class I/II-fold pyridoxal phosphate-dependent enzyme [Antarcticibacterium flavum]|uniref:Aminotransferase class I/II-fold pyridoxal phosphate-dependent enzyme n=1 Tax=Antarcticibacterium flavum TaxID=2058175 RepID=A0A5B7X0C5_9FLAO|nr:MULTISPECIES: bifunctional aminotransferase class I/II-fold pyridoxal phosphate-dependent enzyme/GNAT family N-acetyltransferase [Antarcticibacterium]MCM4161597.1 aminotransferase class I/II [Antarcticibacterium sp. W02-3]QCY69034.1 aminotransferase class I/II-fold pyridoxal phosphate-dependent enzyme [Antarcticibacterium flavum]
MAKIRHNNFLDTVDEVFSNAKREGVLHLFSQDEVLSGRTIKIKGRDLFHFGTTGYLGLEQDERLKRAGMDAIWKLGTQFPLSRTYVSHPLYDEMEEKISRMYGNPVVITKNSTLGHIAVIPTAVRDEDAVILDHQVHWSVQNAVQVLKTRGVPVEMIRHNNLEMLEDKIKELRNKVSKIWYMADGVYSMYGDFAPVKELMRLGKKYPQLHFYFDDVHGMSWRGKNGTGYVMGELEGNLPENVLLIGTLSKTFGASGALMSCSNRDLHRKIKTFGGPLTFSAQLEPASVAAASASADIHLSPEIYVLQEELNSKINYFNDLLEKTQLPLIEKNSSPVFYIGTGMPVTGYNFVKRLMGEGFFVNLGIYPAVPVKNTGVRLTISRHNQNQEMEALVEAMCYHYPKSLEDTHTTPGRVRRAFKMPEKELPNIIAIETNLQVQKENSISKIEKEEWDSVLGGHSTFDWEGLKFLEQVFSNENLPQHNWKFHYFLIKDKTGRIILATFFTEGLWKDDMLAPVSVSLQFEERRKMEPYYMSSKVLALGSLFTEGEHLYLDWNHEEREDALKLFFLHTEDLEQHAGAAMLVLRDFEENNPIAEVFLNKGFIPVTMPESCIMDNLSWKTEEEFVNSLSSRSRRHFKNEVASFVKKFEVEIIDTPTLEKIDQYFELYKNVKEQNFGLNTFTFPRDLFTKMASHPNWEFIVLQLREDIDPRPVRKPVGVMFCYKNLGITYSPSFIGMDYSFSREYNIYRQLLFQTIKRARELKFQQVDLGFSASFEKRKLGARVIPKVAYVQAKDNFSMELMGTVQST